MAPQKIRSRPDCKNLYQVVNHLNRNRIRQGRNLSYSCLSSLLAHRKLGTLGTSEQEPKFRKLAGQVLHNLRTDQDEPH